MAFENFPYTDYHTLNLDWILKKLKELLESMGTDAELVKLRRQIESNSVSLTGGNGLLAFMLRNLTNMTPDTNAFNLWRDKRSNTLIAHIRLTNNTGSTVLSGTDLMVVPGLNIGFGSIILFCDCYVLTTDGLRTDGTAYLRKLDDGTHVIDCNLAVPNTAQLVISGVTTVAQADDTLLNRGYFPSELGARIAYAFMHGTPEDEWHAGEFTYDTSNAVRLNPAARATDCSGMTTLAFRTQGVSPYPTEQRGIFSAAMILSYAPLNEDLDVSMGQAGDIICYKNPDNDPNEPGSITHCTLYAGGNVTYEMARTYPAFERAQGCIDGKGPYVITTPASEYRKDTRARYLVRIL